MTDPLEKNHGNRPDTETASLRILRSTLPGWTPTRWVSLAETLRKRPFIDELDSEEKYLHVCATAYALSHLGRTDEATDLIDRYLCDLSTPPPPL